MLRYRRYFLAASFVAVLLAVTVIFSEIALQMAARISPVADIALFPRAAKRLLPDSKLKHRGNPKFREHDANGFRNTAVPDTTDIVALGDSQTYGTSAAFNQAWPRVLEQLTSCRVYSMAHGGYGPLEYMDLAQRAVKFKPHLILVGIYFGNDFYDSWQMYLRDPSKYDVPREILNKALARERQNPLSRDVVNFLELGRSRSFLSRNSALWGLGRAIHKKLFPQQYSHSVLRNDLRMAVTALTPEQLEYASIFEGKDWKTILTARYRKAAQDIDDPRIEVGVWLTKWAIQNISELARQHHIATIFILLPTKESVFVGKGRFPAGDSYTEKMANGEKQIRRDLIDYLGKNSLVYIDMAPSLQSMVNQPYFENVDGHPNAIGYAKIAMELLAHIGTCPN